MSTIYRKSVTVKTPSPVFTVDFGYGPVTFRYSDVEVVASEDPDIQAGDFPWPPSSEGTLTLPDIMFPADMDTLPEGFHPVLESNEIRYLRCPEKDALFSLDYDDYATPVVPALPFKVWDAWSLTGTRYSLDARNQLWRCLGRGYWIAQRLENAVEEGRIPEEIKTVLGGLDPSWMREARKAGWIPGRSSEPTPE
jgi:hypothetical protein